jgi:hypothetical protein
MTYIRCQSGYFKRFTVDGEVECQACRGAQTWARYVTPGLGPNEPASCLWECHNGLSTRVVWDGTTCNSAGSRGDVPMHKPGWYGGIETPTKTCDGGGYTSEANTALNALECLKCPTRPANSEAVPGGEQCEWGARTAGWPGGPGVCGGGCWGSRVTARG